MCPAADPGRVVGMGVRGLVRRRPVTAFVVLVLVLVLVLGWPMLLIGERVPVAVVPLTVLGPGACAVLVTWLADGPGGVRELLGRLGRWRVPVRWYLFAVFGLAVGYWSVALVVHAVFGPAELTPPPLEQWLVAPVSFVALVVLLGLVEELGWRGFLLPRLSARLTPLRAALVVGLVWWAWHLPIRVRLDRPEGAAFAWLFLVGILADAVVIAWVFHRSGGSVLLVALMHAATNTWGGTLLYGQMFAANDPSAYLPYEIVRMGTYAVVAVVVVVLTRGQLGVPPPVAVRTSAQEPQSR
jgi:uncharacterized protein